jgi:carboxyl-terminal processing protease
MQRERHVVRSYRWLFFLALSAGQLVAALPRARTQEAAEPAAAADESRQRMQERELLRLLSDTLEQVRAHYVDARISERELIEAAIEGMVSRLDPYSHYIRPEELDQFRKGVEREFIGIGIQVSERDGHLQIISPLYGTPAWRAGLRAGDRILQINDTSTRDLSLTDAMRLISGESGTEVKISVLHPNETQAETVTLKRELIQQPTVLGYRRQSAGQWDFFCDPSSKIGYIRIAAFSRKTADDVGQTLQQLLADGMQGLVLDLRFNPGGMLNQAIEVSDLFLHQGRIVSIAGRATDERAWDARSDGTLVPRDFPVAVLVNRFSASAAEIVSAALQDNRAAVVVGERTWGKGSVQNIVELERGKSALKLTTAGYQRPNGKNIHRAAGAADTDDWGVRPDEGFGVPCTDRELFELSLHLTQWDAAPQPSDGPHAAPGGDHVPAGDDAQGPTDGAPPFVDRQLDKALEYVRGRLSAPQAAAAADHSLGAGS